ncbi:pentatricopeptide repeat-containing protein At4g11690-like [Eucalyptus grandis]|uniref:pentatricopeptide repeat-containing protein At4g11690-like n=1 Tax=Eucalyptus grandis TaxID=71139 RepID=UPI00192ED07A|nr:pentatricopeptide repeat-containing protein At4g11690-like [Eucalyptus grandis]
MVKNGLVPYPSAFNTLLSSLVRSGSFDEAWRLLSDSRAKVGILDERSLGIMVKGCCKAGRSDRGFKICAQLKEMNWSPVAYVYTALIDGCCKHGHVERAGELFSEMSELGLVAKRNTYRVVIDGYLRKGMKGDGLELYRKMKLSGVVPSVHTCNLMINVLCKGGYVNRAFELFDEMRERGIAYSVVTFNTLIRGLHCDSRVWEAERLVDLMKGAWDKAFSLFDQLKLKGHSPSLVTYNTLIAGSARAKNMPTMTDLVKEMEQRDIGSRPKPQAREHPSMGQAHSWAQPTARVGQVVGTRRLQRRWTGGLACSKDGGAKRKENGKEEERKKKKQQGLARGGVHTKGDKGKEGGKGQEGQGMHQ